MAIPTQRTASIWACATLIWLAADRHAVVTVPQADGLRSARAAARADVSADGRYVAFESWAQLVPADTDRQPDVYVLDRTSGRVTLESVDPGDDQAGYPRLSGDGRLIVFEARHGADLPRVDIIVRDRMTLLSRSLTETVQQEGLLAWSRQPAISGRGHVVAFSSAATTLCRGTDVNGRLKTSTSSIWPRAGVRRVSLTSANEQLPTGDSIAPSLSPDGRWLAFASTAPLDTGRATGAAERARAQHLPARSRRRHHAAGLAAAPRRSRQRRQLASVGQRRRAVRDVRVGRVEPVAEPDRNRGTDVFVFDREKEEVARVSRAVGGASPNGASTHPVISADGRFVAFQSEASNLVCGEACPARRPGHQSAVGRVPLRSAPPARPAGSARTSSAAGWNGAAARRWTRPARSSPSRPGIATGADDGRGDLDLFVQRRPARPGPRQPQ